MVQDIYVVQEEKEHKFLRKKTQDFDFSSMTLKEINALLVRMKKIMRVASGIGLSANQIGLPFRLFVAEVPVVKGASKFYAIFNATIEKKGPEMAEDEEGCLSVPGTFGPVKRSDKIVLTGFDKHGNPLKIKAWGLLARVFQHEIDHLDGKLFIDRAKKIYTHEPQTI